MKAQIPAEGILKSNDWGDTKVYEITCECSDSDHNHKLWVEADDCRVTATVYTTVKSNFWSKNRFQLIWELLTKGFVKYESSIIMNEQQALNYAETLKSAISDVDQFRKQRSKTNDINP
jgi:hypothetical protein